nr:hypothetical protein [uncultured Bacteroides sp.]
MKNIYSVKWCPIPFHDLLEIFDFLSSLSVVHLYQFDGAIVLLNGVPLMHLIVYCKDGLYYVTYRMLLRRHGFCQRRSRDTENQTLDV